MNSMAGFSFKAEELVSVQEGAIVSRTIIDKPVGTVTVFAFGAGQALSEHSAPYDALVQVLDGEFEIKIAGEPHLIKGGEWILLPADVTHAVDAREDSRMVLVMIRE